MSHTTSSPDVVFFSAPPPSAPLPRIRLLCGEPLRAVACALEGALRERGWEVSVEFGIHARPWVQQTTPESCCVRVLFIPGPHDPAVLQRIRQVLAPDPHSDLHLLPIDDCPDLIGRIEQFAGVERPASPPVAWRPALRSSGRLAPTVRRTPRWGLAASSALAAFVITLGGLVATHPDAIISARAVHANVQAPAVPVESLRPAATPLERPVLSAIAPLSPTEWVDEWDDEDIIIILEDDEDDPPRPHRRMRRVARTGNSANVHAPALAELPPVLSASIEDLSSSSQLELAPEPLAVMQQLPVGFLPVAGLLVAQPPDPTPVPVSPMTTVDPFANPAAATLVRPRVTVDPFADLPVPDTVPMTR